MNFNKKNSIRNMVVSGIFIAIGIVLPMAFHWMADAGKILLPMHIPVIIIAFFVPIPYAVAVGVITPLLSSLLTGMPPMAPLPMAIIMMFELGVYGLVISMLRNKVVNPAKWYTPFFALIPAQILGRCTAGVVLFVAVKLFAVKGPSVWVFLSGGILTGLPGIIIQLILVPTLYLILAKNLPTWIDQKKKD